MIFHDMVDGCEILHELIGGFSWFHPVGDAGFRNHPQ
jgi:hypothetical protein